MLAKIYNFLKKEIAYTTQLNSSGKGKYLTYAHDDAFPLRLTELIQGSPTASSCVDTITDFITGEGFNDHTLEKLIINNHGQTFFDFHQMNAAALAQFDGLAFEVKYSKTGKILELYNTSFENCRLGQPDSSGIISDILYNPYFGAAAYQEKDTKVYKSYDNRPEIAVQQAKDPHFLGQIFWFGVPSPLNKHYPRPRIYSAHDAMGVERRTLEAFNKNLQSGFLQSTIMKLIGDPNEPIPDPDEYCADCEDHVMITKGEYFDRVMSTSFSGSERAGYIMALWANNKDEHPTLEAFPTNANSEIYKTQSELASEKIMIAAKVPSILAINREGQSLGGDGNSMRAAVKLMQQRAVRPHQILTDIYQKILPRLAANPFSGEIEITSYDPYPEAQSVDPAIWTEMTSEERRLWIKNNTDIVLIAPRETEPEPAPTQARYEAMAYNTYPDKAKANAKRAIEWQDSTGIKCGGRSGLDLAQRISDGVPLSGKEIKRLSNYLSKKTIFKDGEWSKSCEAVNYYLWGGSEMMNWANEKVKEWLS